MARSFLYRWSFLSLSLGLGLGLPSCGSVHDDPPATVPEAEFVHAYAQAYCDVSATCCTAANLKLNDSCASAVEATLFNAVDYLIHGSHPHFSYDPVQAAKCVASMRSGKAECESGSVVSNEKTACGFNFSLVFPGALPPGSPCEGSVECAASPGGFASCNAPSARCRPGVYVSAGSSCDHNPPDDSLSPIRHCDSNSWCDPSNTCVALPLSGESCAQLSCASGSYCQFKNFLCTPLPKKGEHCETQCVEDFDLLFCDLNTSTCSLPRETGEPCITNSDCLSTICGSEGCVAHPARTSLNAQVCTSK